MLIFIVTKLDSAHRCLLKAIQSKGYNEEISRCLSGDAALRFSRLLPLYPFVDAAGILRVGPIRIIV